MIRSLWFWLLRLFIVGVFTSLTYFLAFTKNTNEKPIEEPYWGVSQFETSYWRLKATLAKVGYGDSTAQNSAKSSVLLFLSKLRLLTRDSQSRDILMKNIAFSSRYDDLISLQRDIENVIENQFELDLIYTIAILSRLEEAQSLVSGLASDVHQMQLMDFEAAFELNRSRDRQIANLLAALIAMSVFVLMIDSYYNWYLYRKNRELKRNRDELTKRNHELDKQKKLLEASVVEKNEFMAMVSHELKSPLQTISSSAESLTNPVDPQKRAALLGRIQRATISMKMQINDLLTLARSEAGALEFRPDEFCVQELLQEVLDLASQEAYEKSLRLSINAPREPIFAIADSGRLIQILGNLFMNAVKYTQHGKVELALSSYDTRHLTFTVHDTGPGMPSGFAPLEIQPFKRYGSLRGDGAGIGLKIAYSLAEYLSGSLAYESDNFGTCFTLRIPVVLIIEGAHTPLTTHRQRWLLVDDNQDLLVSLQSECQALGIEADIAPSPAIAANMMAGTAYDVALIDVNMPGRRGDELAADFRRGGAMANLNCLLYGMSAVHQAKPDQRTPFDRLLDKPIRIKSVLATVTRQVSDSPSIRPL